MIQGVFIPPEPYRFRKNKRLKSLAFGDIDEKQILHTYF
jgi:hypothetical protein